MSTIHGSAVPDAHPFTDVGIADTPNITSPAVHPHVAKRQGAYRRQILDTATQLFSAKGCVDMMMSNLYNTFGMTKPAVYCYFTDRYEIFDILCREAAQICLPAIRETASPVLPVRERLQAYLLEMARHRIDCYYAAALTYRDRQYSRSETVEWLHGMSRSYYHDLYALPDRGKCAGVFSFGDACVAAHSIGGVMGFMYTWYDPLCIDTQTLAIELLGAMMKIILPAAPNPATKPTP